MIAVRVVRPLLYNGVPYAAGAMIEAEPLEAHEIIASGRAVLEHAADAPRVRAAAIAERDRLIRTLNAADRAASWVRRVA